MKMYDNSEETNPKYYESGFQMDELQCIAISRFLKFAPGNAFKYIWRAGNKSSETEEKDLRKALWYLYDWRAWYPYTHVGGDHNEAKAVFDLIKPDGTERYAALSEIIDHNIDAAIRIVLKMLGEDPNVVWKELYK